MTRDELISRLEGLKQRHDVAEDSWYTCPKAQAERPHDIEAHCSNDGLRDSGICTCGADFLNSQLDSLITDIRTESIT